MWSSLGSILGVQQEGQSVKLDGESKGNKRIKHKKILRLFVCFVVVIMCMVTLPMMKNPQGK